MSKQQSAGHERNKSTCLGTARPVRRGQHASHTERWLQEDALFGQQAVDLKHADQLFELERRGSSRRSLLVHHAEKTSGPQHVRIQLSSFELLNSLCCVGVDGDMELRLTVHDAFYNIAFQVSVSIHLVILFQQDGSHLFQLGLTTFP